MKRARGFGLAALLVVSVGAAVVASHFANGPLDIEPLEPPPRENLIGRAVPDFAMITVDGQSISRASVHGRVAVINIWATWCGPCVTELPRLEKEIWQRHASNVAVVAVARGESVSKLREFNVRSRLTFPVVADPDRRITSLFGGDDSIPRTYLVNRAGVIVYQSFGYTASGFEKLVAAIDREAER
jgi:peroxiredoxin